MRWVYEKGSGIVGDDGQIAFLDGFILDITERKRLEEKMRGLATITEQAAEGIAVANLEGIIEFANHAWAAMHGYDSGEELKGRPLSIFHTDEQLKTDVIPFNEQVKQHGRNVGEVGHMRKDGRTFPTMMSVTVLRDVHDRPYAIALFAQDITERKRAEEVVERYTGKRVNMNYD